ncbi:hypothetical protein [Nonomuraea typhae]|uniref:hypothetical protein n=1 Tax=Nonomuraea typhae TaxID=2603600 RepID=UPI0012F8DF2F|nr:hypothetical protein [Nonomuraea typhae]
MTATDQRSVAPRRSRQSTRRRAGGSKVIGAIAGLALAAAAVGLQTFGLSADDMAMPLTTVGAKGEEVSAQRFSVRVDGVKSAKTIKSGDKTAVTDGLFLVIEVAATVPAEPIHLNPPILLTEDGRRFDATDKVDKAKTLANPWIQPGWWSSGAFVFEVPAAVLAGAKATFIAPTSAFYGEPLLPEAEIDLGIDEAAAKQLAAAPQDVYTLGEKK